MASRSGRLAPDAAPHRDTIVRSFALPGRQMGALSLGLAALALRCSAPAGGGGGSAPTRVHVDTSGPSLTYDGAGGALSRTRIWDTNSPMISDSSGVPVFAIRGNAAGLSAGASSRLLIDYEEQPRAEILDYLCELLLIGMRRAALSRPAANNPRA
eukprot:SAG31_NODE_1158_length_9605_cov_2.788555_12_plen_156_part_00